MSKRNFCEMLEAKWAESKFVCVGLDSEYEKIPRGIQDGDEYETLYKFNCGIIDATKNLVCAYKPNIAFYERYGQAGMDALLDTIAHIHLTAPNVPVILDAKRGDTRNTNLGYVEAAFDKLRADAITVHPYLGQEALKPFLDRVDKGIIVLCRTSNPGAGEFQDVVLSHGWPLYKFVAHRVAQIWNTNKNCGLVVGATYPDELREVRGLVGDMPILILGIGAQGGDVEKTVSAGKDSRGQGMIINSSRAIIYASNGIDYTETARRETQELHDMINRYRLAAPS